MALVARLKFMATGASQVKAESDAVSEAVSKSAKKTEAAQERMKKAANFASTAILGAAAAVGYYGVKSAIGVEDGSVRVQNALKNTNLTIAQQTAAYNRMKAAAIDASTHGGGSQEEELAGLGQLTTLTGHATSAIAANTTANKLAVGAQMSYSQALQMVTGAEAGRMRGLQKFIGIVTPIKAAEQQLADSHNVNIAAIDREAAAMGKAGTLWKEQQLLAHGVTKAQEAAAATADKQATAQKALDLVNRKYATAQETTTQKISDMKHGLQNMAASLGAALLPMIQKAIKFITDLSQIMMRHKTIVMVVTGVLVGLALAYKTMIAIQKLGQLVTAANTVAMKVFGSASKAAGVESAEGAEIASIGWREFMAATLIGIVLVGIVELVQHWKQVQKVVADVAKAIAGALTAAWNAIESAFTTVFDFIKNHWQLILSILTGPIGAAVIFIATHFNDVKRVVMDVIHFIENLFKGIFNALTFPFRKAFDFIKKGFDAVKGFIKGIPIIGGLFSQGGVVHRAQGGPIYRAMGGPSGTDTVPAWLTPGETVMTRAASNQFGSQLAAMNSGVSPAGAEVGPENFVIQPAPITIKLDSRVIAQSVLKQTLSKAARGSSNLVGGNFATSGGYSPASPGAAA